MGSRMGSKNESWRGRGLGRWRGLPGTGLVFADAEQPAPETALAAFVARLGLTFLDEQAGLVFRGETGDEADAARARAAGIGGVTIVADPDPVDALAAEALLGRRDPV